MRLFTTLGATIFGYIGWWLAEPLGFGWAFVLSGVASMVGVYVGWWLARRYL